MSRLVLKNLRLWGRGDPRDIALAGGRIEQIGADLGEGEDFAGRAALPGLVEAHCHLDKNYSLGAGDLENASGTLLEAIERWSGSVPRRGPADYRLRAEQGLRQAVAKGVTHLRTHVDLTDQAGLVALQALLEVRAAWQSRVGVQIAVLGYPGTPEQDALMAEGLRMGADVVGGCPMLTPDSEASLKSALDLGERFGKPVDLHLDETEDPAVFDLEALVGMVEARGLGGRVSAGHCCSWSFQPPAAQARVIEQAVGAGVGLISLPAANLVLQGKGRPPARGLMPLKALHRAGARLALGSDNVRDPFLPLGNYDPLWQANLAVHAADLTSPAERWAAVQMVSLEAARMLGIAGYGLEAGCRADLVILDCAHWEEALALMPPRLRVYKSGLLTYRQEVSQAWT